MNLVALGINPEWEDYLKSVFEKYDISTPLRKAAFIGQCGHESASFKILEENLNYSAQSLLNVFPSRFDIQTADDYAHNPEKIANKIYAGRMGNTEDGDGWKFHGRGLIQITGREMYSNVADALGLDLLNSPELLIEKNNASMSAGWFWNKKGLNYLADAKNWQEITRRINGGTNGLQDRIDRINKALTIF